MKHMAIILFILPLTGCEVSPGKLSISSGKEDPVSLIQEYDPNKSIRSEAYYNPPRLMHQDETLSSIINQRYQKIKNKKNTIDLKNKKNATGLKKLPTHNILIDDVNGS